MYKIPNDNWKHVSVPIKLNDNTVYNQLLVVSLDNKHVK